MSQKIITKNDIDSVDAAQINESADKSFISTTEKSKLSSITAIFTTELKALYDGKLSMYYPQNSLIVLPTLPSAATYNGYECVVGNLIYSSDGIEWTLLVGLDAGTFFFDQDSNLYQISQTEGVNNRIMFGTKAAIEALLTGLITTHNHYTYDQIALSNNGADATDLSVGIKLTETVTHASTWYDIAASVATAPTGGTLIVNIKKNGTTIFSTLLSIDATEKTSVTAATPYVFTTNPTVWAVGDVREYSITQVGAVAAGKGLIITVKKTN